MDIRIKEVLTNIKNHDYKVLGHYRMDQAEGKKLIRAILDEMDWKIVSEELPPVNHKVYARYRYEVNWGNEGKRYNYDRVIAVYIPYMTVKAEDLWNELEDDSCCEYNEEDDEIYAIEGWYEVTTQGNGDIMYWYINAEVIEWHELPEYNPALGVCRNAPDGYDILRCPYQKNGCKMQCKRVI